MGKVGKYSLFRALNQPFEAFLVNIQGCSRAAAILVWEMEIYGKTYDRHRQNHRTSHKCGASRNHSNKYFEFNK